MKTFILPVISLPAHSSIHPIQSFVCLSVCLSMSSVCLYLSSVYMSVSCPHVCLYVCLHVVYLSISLSVCPSVYLSLRLSVCLAMQPPCIIANVIMQTGHSECPARRHGARMRERCPCAWLREDEDDACFGLVASDYLCRLRNAMLLCCIAEFVLQVFFQGRTDGKEEGKE